MKNMMNMMGMIKKAQEVQNKMNAINDQMADRIFVGTAGGNAVSVSLTGKFIAQSVKIDPSVLDDIETLQDLLVVAFNDAKTKVDMATDEAFSSIKKELNLPENFKLPF